VCKGDAQNNDKLPARQLRQPQESREHIHVSQTLAANLPTAWLTKRRNMPKKGILAFAQQLHLESSVPLDFSQLCSQGKDLPNDCCRVPWLVGFYADIFQHKKNLRAFLLLLFWKGFVYAFTEDPYELLPVWWQKVISIVRNKWNKERYFAPNV